MRTLYLSLKKMPKFKHRLLMVALLALVVSSTSWLSIFFLQLSEQKSHNLGLLAHLSPDSGPYHDCLRRRFLRNAPNPQDLRLSHQFQQV
ncbi:hypothetical protein ACFX15_026257 [Malus domestica]